MLVRVMIRGGSFHGLFSMSGRYGRSPNSSIPSGFFFLNGKQRKGETGKKIFFLSLLFFPQYKSGILTQGLHIFFLYLFLSSGDSKESNQGVYFLQQKDCDTRGTINFSLLFSFFFFSFSTYSYDEKRLQQQLEFLQPIYIGGTLFFDSFLTLICEYFRKGKSESESEK